MLNSRKKYSDEEILEHLKDHNRRNLSISKRGFDADKTVCSVSAVSMRFGSWAEGLKRAGLNIKDLKTYSDEDILNQLRDHYKRNGKITRSSFERDKTVCSSTIVSNRFGNWEKVLEKAGIPSQEITKKVVIRDLKAHYKKYGKITRRKFNEDKTVCSSSVVRKRFGSWNKALEISGIKEIEYIEYDKEKILEILKLNIKREKLKFKEDIRRIKGIPSVGYIEKLYNCNWKELFETLGLEVRNYSYTKDYLIQKYKDMKKKKNYKKKKITSTEFNLENKISSSTIFKYFGSWNNFLKLMKEETLLEMSKVEHTKAELLLMYRDFSIKIGKGATGATQDDIDENFIYKSSILERRFGSLNKMRELLGMEIRFSGHKKYTKNQLTEKLLEKYKEYGRKITQKEMTYFREHEENFPGMSTFLLHFKTTRMSEVWKEVLKEKNISK